MEWLSHFIVTNFILICVSAIMIAFTIQRFRQHPKISIYIFLIISFALLLAVSNALQEYCKQMGSVAGAFIFSTIGYTLRPACIYLFILMTYQKKKGQLFYLTAIPLVITFFVYMLGIVPGAREYVVYFARNDDGTVRWVAGGFLRWTSHLVGLGYLIWITFISLSILKMKHLSHGITILTCAVFVILSVVIESFFSSGDVEVLNTTIAVSTMIYYLYLYIERNQIDTLTNCFTRETYYHDLPKMERNITGIIQFDMNGLKYLNDSFGHAEGDRALSTIGSIIISCAKRKMYVYRLGGDEFLLLANNYSEEELLDTIDSFKEKLSKTQYHCSVGYSYRHTSSDISIDDMLKDSERKMYEDKAEYYKDANIERRKR